MSTIILNDIILMTSDSNVTNPVEHSIHVAVEPARAFDVFASHTIEWWNPSYSGNPTKAPIAAIVLEPRVGGRWFERGTDGSECEWARVLVYEPAARLVLDWHVPGKSTEVEIRFEGPAPRRTNVTVVHRGWEVFGNDAAKMRAAHDSSWLDLLDRFAAVVQRNAAAINNEPSAPRAVTDGDTVLATIDIPVSPERVFRAVTTSECEQWWGASDTYRTTQWQSNLRVGGGWSCVIRLADGAEFPASGQYLDVDAPHRVVQTRRYDWDYPDLGRRDTTVAYRFDEIATGTRVTVRQDGFLGMRGPAEHHVEGWEGFLKYLSGYLRAEAAV